MSSETTGILAVITFDGGSYMKATKAKRNTENQILVDTIGLQEMLSSGRATAVQIGTDAGARVQIGRRVFWNVRKVQEYIDSISE